MIHNDHLGTPQKMTDASGSVVWTTDYKPFGETTITVSTITNNLRFPGQYFDAETGLFYNINRDYNQAIGRFIEPDPIGISQGSKQLYVYAENDPVNLTDPLGLCVWKGSVTMKVIGGRKGAAGSVVFMALSSECCHRKKASGLYTAFGLGGSWVPKLIPNFVQTSTTIITFDGPDTPSDSDPKGWFSYLSAGVFAGSWSRLRTGSLVSKGLWNWEFGNDLGITSLLGATIGSGKTTCCN